MNEKEEDDDPAVPYPDGFNDPSGYVEALQSFLNTYYIIAHFNSRDTFTGSAWENTVPAEWRKTLDEQWKGICDLDAWVDFWVQTVTSDTIPESLTTCTSLKSFIDQCHQIPLKRSPDIDVGCETVRMPQGARTSLKKQHERNILSKYLRDMLAKYHTIESVVDIGSGLGYLTADLSLNWHRQTARSLDVCGIEGKESNIEEAKRRLDLTTKNTPEAKVKYYQAYLASADDINLAMTKLHSPSSKVSLTCSLHACGNLSAHMLRHFIQSDKVEMVVNIGCCYNLITERFIQPIGCQCCKPGMQDEYQHTEVKVQYPMSKLVTFALGERLRTLALQATQKWPNVQTCRIMFRKHLYRAILQHILLKHGLVSADDRPKLHSTGKLKSRFFTQGYIYYAKEALKRIGFAEKLTQEQIVEGYEEVAHLAYRVVVVVTLRALCASLVESLILMDRWAYVKEELDKAAELGRRGGAVKLVELFHPATSPRGWAVVGVKDATT